MQVRPATLDDIAAIHAIYAHHVVHGLASFEEIAPSAHELRSRYEDVVSRGFPYLVSIGLHASQGFVRVGTLRSVGYKHGRWVDCVIMQRPIGPGDGAPPAA